MVGIMVLLVPNNSVLAIPATSSPPQEITVQVKIQENLQKSTVLVPKPPYPVQTNIIQAKQFQLIPAKSSPAQEFSIPVKIQENLSKVLVPQSPNPVQTNIIQAKQFHLDSTFSQKQSQFLQGGRSIRPPLVEIGLTDLPKIGEARAPLAPLLTTGLLLGTESLPVQLVKTYTGLLLHPIGEIMLNLVLGIYLTLHYMRVKIKGFVKNKFEIFKNQMIKESVPNSAQYTQWPENPNFVK